MSKDIHYKTNDYNQESSTIQSINNILKGKDFKDVDKIMENAQNDINSLDEDGVISLTHALVGHKGAKLMGYYQDELYEYAKNLDAKMKEIIDTPFVDDLEKAIDGVSNVKLKNILIKNGGGKGNDTYGASGKIAKEGAKKGDSDVYSIDEILKSDKSFQKVIDQNYERMHKEDKDLKKSDFETYVTQGSSFDYITNKEEAKIKAEQEKLKEQQKTETAVDVAATVGIVALTIVNPVAGTVAAGAYTAYSVANAATGKNVITGRKMSKNERLMEGLLAIPLPGASFLKSTGKSMSKLAFTGSKNLAVKTGMHEGMQNMASRMTPKMTAMKDSVLNQSKNFKQNNRVGQMLSNMRGQASNTVQQGKQWIGHQAQQVKQATNHILEKEIPFTQPRVAVAGVGSVQAGKGVTLKEAGQSIQRTFSSNHQVTHTPKDSMVKSEGKHVSSSQSHGSNSVHYQEDPNLTKVEYGDHYERRFMKPKKLKANIEYTTPHGHVYRTDHQGRIKEVYAEDLSLHDGGRNSYAQRTVGRKDRLPDDDGGHLIARAFGGSKDIDNLVPQSKYINRPFKDNGKWYMMEKEWREAIESGDQVKNIKIEVKYSENSQRPNKFDVSCEINGEERLYSIENI
ncbi:DNA/RNA non-specific endonuclease [Staphylococcus epidermidis]|uniref:DNA/RNA non-specific endonuclease n=1 Tax=Staphylococcus epidermidis TaxID=1282 RepID=UPI0021A44AEC|nr:DNA/RNA non-specific endonuclease [Staphylococcus epidermidis]MCT1763351.1 DNA/RNA non-specific endonuclease [Staphylococcus epidermidis]MCT1831848.1 DNA/RNA non-specific endonuclease [Staphylococcus epidermidis]MDH9059218.1 DNA/RNA non-specific endonuclease [Staphylococcus epidermidis]MDH9608029.1 DNA/RNA non-specific endonuclease [Staphylococcus epidermidis]